MQQQLVERRDELVRIVAESIPRSKINRCAVGYSGDGPDGCKDHPVTKLSRRKEVSEEKIANCGPRTLASPGILAVGG